jgi:hypothetical protein
VEKNLPDIIRHHPASFIGSLAAGNPGAVAREDAVPELENEAERPRLLARLGRRLGAAEPRTASSARSA